MSVYIQIEFNWKSFWALNSWILEYLLIEGDLFFLCFVLVLWRNAIIFNLYWKLISGLELERVSCYPNKPSFRCDNSFSLFIFLWKKIYFYFNRVGIGLLLSLIYCFEFFAPKSCFSYLLQPCARLSHSQKIYPVTHWSQFSPFPWLLWVESLCSPFVEAEGCVTHTKKSAEEKVNPTV